MLIMWGCLIAVAITFPLVFGWLHFRPVPGDLVALRGGRRSAFPPFGFRTNRLIAFFLFHGLVWASFLVIAGVMLAMRRRMREEGAAAVQRFAEDFMPLILLFAVSLTGLMLTASYTWMKGYAYTFIAILHAITVIVTFLWLPFGKFFHIFQRPAQLGVGFYKDVGRERGTGALPALRPRVQLAHARRGSDRRSSGGSASPYEIPGERRALPVDLPAAAGARRFAMAQGAVCGGAGGAARRCGDGAPAADATFTPIPRLRPGSARRRRRRRISSRSPTDDRSALTL